MIQTIIIDIGPNLLSVLGIASGLLGGFCFIVLTAFCAWLAFK